MSKNVTDGVIDRSLYDQQVTDRERRYKLRTERTTYHSEGAGVAEIPGYLANTTDHLDTTPESADELPPGWECFVLQNGQVSLNQVQEKTAKEAEELAYRQTDYSVPWNEWNPYHTSASTKNWFAPTGTEYRTSQTFSDNPWTRDYGTGLNTYWRGEKRRRNAAGVRCRLCQDPLATV